MESLGCVLIKTIEARLRSMDRQTKEGQAASGASKVETASAVAARVTGGSTRTLGTAGQRG